MPRERTVRVPPVYVVEFVRGRERRTYRVLGCWNQDDAHVEGVKRLKAEGEKVGGPDRDWWPVGTRRER